MRMQHNMGINPGLGAHPRISNETYIAETFLAGITRINLSVRSLIVGTLDVTLICIAV